MTNLVLDHIEPSSWLKVAHENAIRELEQEIRQAPDFLFSYPKSTGLPRLKNVLAAIHDTSPEHIIVFDSATEALSAWINTLSPNQKIFVQEPFYFIVGRHKHRAEFWSNLSELEKKLTRFGGEGVIHSNSLSHTITGESLNLSELKRLASAKGFPLVLDNPYSLFSPKHIADITIGSFSKIFGPGTRGGYIIAPDPNTFLLLKRQKITAGLGANSFLQHYLLNLLPNLSDLKQDAISEAKHTQLQWTEAFQTHTHNFHKFASVVSLQIKNFPSWKENLKAQGIKVQNVLHSYARTPHKWWVPIHLGKVTPDTLTPLLHAQN
jgi:histidinol-phosphate/aromatic aminotransferase/cobyric acid decarboxylase-like protein